MLPLACRDVVHPSLTCTDSTCKISRSSTHHRWIHAIVDRVRFPNLQAPFCLVRVQEVKNRSYLRFWLELASETASFGCVVSCHNSFVRLKSKIDRDRAIAKLAVTSSPIRRGPSDTLISNGRISVNCGLGLHREVVHHRTRTVTTVQSLGQHSVLQRGAFFEKTPAWPQW
jgi:hypothetical protein